MSGDLREQEKQRAETDGGQEESWGSVIAKCKAGTLCRHAGHALLPTRRNPDFMCFPFRTRTRSCHRPTHAFHWTRMDQPANQAGPLGVALSRQNGPKAQGGDKDDLAMARPWLPEFRLFQVGCFTGDGCVGKHHSTSTTAPRAWLPGRVASPPSSLSVHIDKKTPMAEWVLVKATCTVPMLSDQGRFDM